MPVAKETAIEQLRILIDQTESILHQARFSESFHKWLNDAKAALRHIFPRNPDYVEEFARLRYTPSVIGPRTDDSVRAQYYRSGIAAARAMLRSRLDEVQTYWQEESREQAEVLQKIVNPESVFVIHGRQKLADFHNFLRAVGLKPLEWSAARRMTTKPNPYTWEIVDTALTHAGAIAVLFTPDDQARLKEPLWAENENALEKELLPQPRQNVLFEAGVAYGRAPNRTVLVRIGSHRPMSDLAGHHIVNLNNSPESRQAVADALSAAGCPVDLSGSDWYKSGDFDPNL
jgi:predicted nucleotide-binding protein